MKKQAITLEHIYNEMGSMYSDLMNKLEDLRIQISNLKLEPNDNLAEQSPESLNDTDYVTIKADDVYVGGEPATKYNGEDIYNRYFCPAYFKEARDIIRDEYGYELLEIHCLQSSTEGEYAKPGNPTPDKDGCNAWARCVYKDKNGKIAVSRWVFGYSGSSSSDCAVDCASDCGDDVRRSSDFRSGVFGAVAN